MFCNEIGIDMADFEYSPFDKLIKLGYTCPHCGHENSLEIGVPQPDWTSDSHSQSINADVIELECENCKNQLELTLSTGISGGLGILKGVDIVEVTESSEEESGDEEEREEFEELTSPEAVLPPSDIIAFNEMRSCADIYRMYVNNQIDINPDFQRGVVWKNRAQTLFVDSVLKQLPIPSICISLDGNTQKRLVIDGLQRITTMIKFLDPESKWRMSDIGDVDNRIRGKKMADVREDTPQLIEIFENFVIPITVIRCNYSRHDHMQYLFQIFNRLNSGGSKLYNQEIRNCIYQGSFNTLIKQLSRSDLWCSFAGVTPKKVIQARFGHEERILRFFAFNERWSVYAGRFASFLNDYMETYKNSSRKQIEDFSQLFSDTLKIANRIGMVNTNKVISDAVLVGIAHNKEKLNLKTDEEIKARFEDLMAQAEFSPAALGQGLSQKDKVVQRIKKAIEVFGRD